MIDRWRAIGTRMTGRAFQLLSFEVRGLQMAFYILAASALLSSLLALVRDRLLAHVFGAGATLDIYYAAFRIPDLIFVGTGALVSVYILIPELARRSGESQKDYIDTVLAGFSLLAVAVSGVAYLLTPLILTILFPQFLARGDMSLLVALTRIILLQPIFLGLSNILAAVTQARARYALYSISPLLYNLGIIFGTLVLYPLLGLQGLAWGVVLGAFMHFAIQLPSVFADGFFHRLPRIVEPKALFSTVAISIPRALALSMNQVAFIGLTALAGLLASGSIAIFMFAYNLNSVPLSVIGASYSVAAFPTLASALSRGERDLFISHIATAARYIFFWTLPATALAIVLRAYIVRVILGSGAFDWTDTRLTAAGFALFALSLAAQGLTLLLIRGYYAAGRTFMPFFVSLATTAATIGLGAAFLGAYQNHLITTVSQALLRVVDVPGSTVLALAAAYSFVAILGAVILSLHFERRFGGFLSRVWRSWAESVIAAIAAGEAAYIVLTLIGPITLSSTTLSALLHGVAGGVAGICAASFAYYLLQSAEYRETLQSVHARVWRRAPAQTAQGVAIVASAEESSPTSPQ